MTSEPADLHRNNLDRAASPYLLQHKDNPVHWQMWGPAILAAATREDRPILLSIGYAACHWCHVMAHESFENASTADVMNELFVNIKVDREERPDIDQIYMGALHRLGEAGGWPLTMFLTPKGEPFWGGTYFPKEPRFGRPAFTEILRAVSTTYRARRPEVESNARALSASIAERLPAGAQTNMTSATSRELAQRLANAVDRENGGLPGAPKFPNAPLLEFLWRAGERPADRAIREPVLLTLRRIVAGGIHDHLGGGFARYTVDERWLVPHFEKMLYDNAQLLELLALAHLETGGTEFRQAAKGLVAWLDREMLVGDAFAASLDADSEGVEGKFYVWTREEIDTVLGPESGAFFARFYDADPPGNWTDDHSGLTRIILNRLDAPVPSPEEADRLQMLRGKLLESRNLRIRPGRDDKSLADWNGMMISALATTGSALGEPGWVDLADRAFRFISTAMTRSEAGDLRLAHSHRDGRLVWPGMASDYVTMIRAALSLAETRGSVPADYLDLARGWNDALRKHHLTDAGLLATSADDSTDVILRLAPTTDDAVPNPNGVYATALLRLAALTGEDRFRIDAEAILAALSGAAAANPFAHASAWNALDTRLHTAEILIAGPKPGRGELRAAAQKLPFLHRVIRELEDGESLAPDHPAAAFRHRVGDSAAALICYGERCSLPVHDPAEIEVTFAAMRE